MQNKCPKCGIGFPNTLSNSVYTESLQSLDNYQAQYLIDNYQLPLCQGCIHDIRQQFYSISVNPRFTGLSSSPEGSNNVIN